LIHEVKDVTYVFVLGIDEFMFQCANRETGVTQRVRAMMRGVSTERYIVNVQQHAHIVNGCIRTSGIGIGVGISVVIGVGVGAKFVLQNLHKRAQFARGDGRQWNARHCRQQQHQQGNKAREIH